MFPEWSYKKLISITGSSGAGTDYQIRLSISNALGADIDCSGNSENFPAAEDDGGDLRFSNSAEDEELSFWVESVVSGVATVWVKVGDDLGTDRDIYMFYGNALATNASDGGGTFIFFDDFETGTINSSKWDVTGTVAETGGAAKIGKTSNGGGSLGSKDSFGANIRMRGNLYLADTNTSYHSFGLTTPVGGVRNNASLYIHWENDPVLDYQVDNGGSTWYNTGLSGDADGYNSGGVPFLAEVQRLSTGNSKLYIDEVLKVTATARPSTELARIRLGTYDAYKYTYLYWVFIAKFNDTEPDFSSASAEEVNVAGSAAQAARRGAVMMM